MIIMHHGTNILPVPANRVDKKAKNSRYLNSYTYVHYIYVTRLERMTN